MVNRNHSYMERFSFFSFLIFIEERGISYDLLISLSNSVILSLKTLPLHSNSLCLHLHLLRFCSNCVLSLKYYVACADLLLQFQLFSHSGCFCTLMELQLSDFCSIFGFLVHQPCQNPPTNRKPGLVLTNEMIPASLRTCSFYFL